MAVVTVGHHPELTLEEAMKVFQRHFSGKYEVYMYKLVVTRIVVKKSNWVGAMVDLNQKKGKTSFLIYYVTPAGWARGLQGAAFGFLGVLLGSLILRSRYRAIENDVKSFLESAVEFK